MILKKVNLILLAIILIGFGLRLHTLAWRELWYDEAFTASLINNSFFEVIKLSMLDVHPPLYYLTLKIFTSLFGYSEVALRFPSVLFGVALILLVYKLVLYLTDNIPRALIAALVIATNPFLITYSREARSYSMLTFLIVFAFFLVIRAIKEGKYLVLSIILPILFLTHYISIFIMPVFGIILLSQDRIAMNFKKVILSFVPVIIIILMWLPIIIGRSDSTGLNWMPKFTLIRAPQSIHAFLFGTDINIIGVAPALNPFPIANDSLAIMLFMSVLVLIAISKPKKNEILLLSSAIIPMIFIALTSKYLDINLFVERFMMGYGTLLLIYIVIVFRQLNLVIAYVALGIYLSLSFIPTNIGYRELAQYVSDKPLVMTAAEDFITGKYYIPNLKLHKGDWAEWVVIKESDMFDEEKAEDVKSFYLVNRGSLTGWDPTLIIGKFYLYNWEIRN